MAVTGVCQFSAICHLGVHTYLVLSSLTLGLNRRYGFRTDEESPSPLPAACPHGKHGIASDLLNRTVFLLRRLELPIMRQTVAVAYVGAPGQTKMCQSALEWDPLSAFKRDPFERRVLTVALAPSELVGVAETARVRAV